MGVIVCRFSISAMIGSAVTRNRLMPLRGADLLAVACAAFVPRPTVPERAPGSPPNSASAASPSSFPKPKSSNSRTFRAAFKHTFTTFASCSRASRLQLPVLPSPFSRASKRRATVGQTIGLHFGRLGAGPVSPSVFSPGDAMLAREIAAHRLVPIGDLPADGAYRILATGSLAGAAQEPAPSEGSVSGST
ncbi:hypothetical protein ETAA8_09640 [Anatilimnocola aggregata]|uniref:Uncharacterized protein n=1 Tax=Anatilimnocola aggregata TaxID=2528021 RepID=A0A517Y6X7_9BACT|nr:hypothetical protein ETAA8_09640 [Anatilimnocola aggregata]